MLNRPKMKRQHSSVNCNAKRRCRYNNNKSINSKFKEVSSNKNINDNDDDYNENLFCKPENYRSLSCTTIFPNKTVITRDTTTNSISILKDNLYNENATESLIVSTRDCLSEIDIAKINNDYFSSRANNLSSNSVSIGWDNEQPLSAAYTERTNPEKFEFTENLDQKFVDFFDSTLQEFLDTNNN